MNDFDFDDMEEPRAYRTRSKPESDLTKRAIWLFALLVIFAPVAVAAYGFRFEVSGIRHASAIAVMLYCLAFLVVMPIWAGFVVLIAKIMIKIVG